MIRNIVGNGLKSFFYLLSWEAEILCLSQQREEKVFPLFDHDGQHFIVDVAVNS